jgi:hypothetical protein
VKHTSISVVMPPGIDETVVRSEVETELETTEEIPNSVLVGVPTQAITRVRVGS